MKKLLIYFKGNRIRAVLAPLFKMFEAIFELLIPLVVTYIIDVGLKENNKNVLFGMFGVMIALGVVGLVCAISAQYFSARTAVSFATRLRSSLFSHIQSFDYETTDKIGTSTLITRMTGDINSVQTGINMFLRLFMRSPFIVFGAMIMAFTINVHLALIFVITILIISIIVFGILIISMPLYKKNQRHLDRVLGKVRSNYTGVRVIRAFNKEDDEISDFNSKHTELTKTQIFVGRISALLNPLTFVIINMAIIILIDKGAVSVESGVITQGQLVALYNYMTQILVELIKLANLIITLNKAAASASRISSVFDIPSQAIHTAEKESSNEDLAVEFDNVTFGYTKTGDVAIDTLNFSVKKGETIGIIGGTGSGKTTLINLIPGFYFPTQGNVFINGKNTALYDKEELNELIGVVPQKAQLFKGTIRSNLLWGKNDASDGEMWHALKIAEADSFVEQKKDKLDEEIKQNGSNLSGGQKQRLTIARAILKRPEILIFDDSASALDYVTESHLRENLKGLDWTPTVFIVSQRASSILHADKIIVLDDGCIVGCGTHNDLLDSCDVYREIYDSQFSDIKGGGENEK